MRQTHADSPAASSTHRCAYQRIAKSKTYQHVPTCVGHRVQDYFSLGDEEEKEREEAAKRERERETRLADKEARLALKAKQRADRVAARLDRVAARAAAKAAKTEARAEAKAKRRVRLWDGGDAIRQLCVRALRGSATLVT